MKHHYNVAIKILKNVALLFITVVITDALRQSLSGLYTISAEERTMLLSWLLSLFALTWHFATGISPFTAIGFYWIGSAYWYHVFMRTALCVEGPLMLIANGLIYEQFYTWHSGAPYRPYHAAAFQHTLGDPL